MLADKIINIVEKIIEMEQTILLVGAILVTVLGPFALLGYGLYLMFW